MPVENIFMSGNEKTIGGMALPNATIKSGYPLKAADSLWLQIELMNVDDKEKFVWLTLNWEFMDKPLPADYKIGKTIWTSIGPLPPCPGTKPFDWGPSNLTLSQQPKSKIFSEHSQPWKAQSKGYVLATGGHLHDGASSLQVYLNDKVICDSIAVYSDKGGGGMAAAKGLRKRQHEGMAGMDAGHGGEKPKHIDHQEVCLFPSGIPFNKGDTMHLQANYDFTKFTGMKNAKGELDEVMGITGTMVVFDQ
jgi:hypothetical protein